MRGQLTIPEADSILLQTGARRSILIFAITVPCACSLLWLYGGRERLTKSAKPATVTSVDPLFGDSQTRIEMRPGPVFGWYVGLDAVGTSLAAAVVLVLATLGLTRARRV